MPIRCIALVCLLAMSSCKPPLPPSKPPLKYRCTLTAAEAQAVVGEPIALALTLFGEEVAAKKAAYSLSEWYVWERYAGELQEEEKGALAVPEGTLACGTHTLNYTPNRPGTHTLKLLLSAQKSLQVVECVLAVKHKPGQWEALLTADKQGVASKGCAAFTLTLQPAQTYTLKHWEVYALSNKGERCASVQGKVCATDNADAVLAVPYVLSKAQEKLYFFSAHTGLHELQLTLSNTMGDEKHVSVQCCLTP